MNRFLLITALLMTAVMPQAWGYIKSPYPNPYRQTMWNSFTDSIHTFGQSSQQTNKTKMKLHAQRTQTRLNDISNAEMAKFRAKRHAWVKAQESEYQP